MRKELDEKLCNEFPGLYKERGLSPQQTCMCWGFMCGDGWYDIIYDLSKKITELDPKCVAIQVKEKFGSLHFYVGETTSEVHDAVNEAELKSTSICEQCGEPGVIGGKFWLKCLCVKCREEDENEFNKVDHGGKTNEIL